MNTETPTQQPSRTRRVLRRGRRTLVALRDDFDRRRHPARRTQAIERLRRVQPSSVCFVCLGNVCRSPYAEFAARAAADAVGVAVDSAGFIGPDRAPADTAIEAALERGVDHSANRSKLVDEHLLTGAGSVFLFQKDHAGLLRRAGAPAGVPVFLLGDFDPIWDGKRAIIDPWGKPIEEFRRTFDRIDRCLETVLEVLSETRSGQ